MQCKSIHKLLHYIFLNLFTDHWKYESMATMFRFYVVITCQKKKIFVPSPHPFKQLKLDFYSSS
jgi:hypothetical protein